MISTWPLIGRDDEVNAVTEILEAGGNVVVVGVAGVGKSRLIHEVVDKFGAGANWTVATLSSSSIPLGAWAALLPRAGARQDDRYDVLTWAAAALRARRIGAVTLAVDDAHLLDPLSAAVLHQLVLDGAGGVLIGLRSGAPAPDAVVALWKEGYAERIDLQSLSRAETDELLEMALGGPLERRTADRFWELSEGNALVLRELAEAGRRDEELVHRAGLWRWDGLVAPTGRLIELVELRLADLGAAERQMLELLAVGEPLPVAVVEALCPHASLAELERRHLAGVRVSGDSVLAHLAHPLYGEVLRQTMPTTVTRELKGALADTVGGTGVGDEVLRVAVWRMESGRAGPASDYVSAADAANAVFDIDLAERLARQAVTAGGGHPALLALARALVQRRKTDEACAGLRSILDGEATDLVRLEAAELYVEAVFWREGDVDAALAALVEAEGRVKDPVIRGRLLGDRAGLLVARDRLREARGLVARELAADDVHPLVRLVLLYPLAMTEVFGGHADRALALAGEVRALADRYAEQVPRAPGWAAIIAAYSLFAAGRLDDLDLAIAVFSRDVGRSAADAQGYAMLLAGRVALTRGRPATALARLDQALAILERSRSIRRAWCLGLLAEAHAMLGHCEAADAALADAYAAADGRARSWIGDVHRASAWVFAARGEMSRAVDVTVGVADECDASGNKFIGLLAMHDAVRLGARGMCDRLGHLAASMEGPMAAAVGLYANAVAGNHGDGLEAAALAFETLGADLVAAEAVHEAAAIHRSAGLHARAAAATARAHALGERCEGASTPGLAAAGAPAVLTPREREVAVLVARGLSNREVANRLFLSVRTVEGHLARAYQKLGASSREQLPRLLGIVP